MDLALLCILLSFIFSILFSIYCLPNIFNRKNSVKTPLGNTGWPFIGETLEYLSTAKKGVHEKFLTDRIKKYSSKTIKTSLFGQTMVIFCSAEGNKFLFTNENKLVKSWFPRSIDVIFGSSDGSKHIGDDTKIARKLIYPYLKPIAFQKYVEVMDSVTKQHLQEYWNGKEAIKVYPLSKYFTFTLACRLILGIEDPENVARLEKTFQGLAAGIISLPINLPWTKFNRAVKASKALRKEIETMIKQWKKEFSANAVAEYSSEAILPELVKKIHDDGQSIDESDIAYRTLGLIFAAYDTTSAALSSVIMCLAELPNVYNEVLREQTEIARSKRPGELLNWGDIQKMKYSWDVACEVLRLYPPSSGTFRDTMADFTFDGFFIPKGLKIHWNTYATHRNSEYFPDPCKFDPSRFQKNEPVPFSYVPFGGGPRMCPGKEYARIKILVFMYNVVTKFKWKKIFPDEKIISDPHPKPAKGLPVRLYPPQL